MKSLSFNTYSFVPSALFLYPLKNQKTFFRGYIKVALGTIGLIKPTFICSKSTRETLEKGVRYVQK